MAFPTDPIYKLEPDIPNISKGGILKSNGSTSTGHRWLSIPKDPSNTDYAEYLEWVAAGNTAEAAG